MFKNLIPKISDERLQDGLTFFVDGLGFDVLYQDPNMTVIARAGASGIVATPAAIWRTTGDPSPAGSQRFPLAVGDDDRMPGCSQAGHAVSP